MTLAELSVRRPVFAWMLMASLIVFGYLAFRDIGISQLPDVDFPVVNVSVTLEGAAPEVMELDVVDPIESAMMSVSGITGISSSANAGRANVSVEFAVGRDIDTAVQEIQTKIAQVQRILPKDVDPPVISKVNPEDQPILWLGVASESMPAPELMTYVRDKIQDRFLTVPGVADIFLGGYIEPNLRVWVSREKLDRFDLTVTDVVNAIGLEHSEKPSGRIENERNEYNIRTMGEARTVDEFKRLAIQRRGGSPNFSRVSIGDIARVEEGLADIRRKSRVNGNNAVGLGIRKQRGSNAVEVAKAVKKRLVEINKTLPKGTEIGVNFDSTTFVEESIHELNFTLVLAAILTGVVCFIFLGSWSSTVNVLLAIPTSCVGTFLLFKLMGFTLNTFTLLGLSLAVGIVVDDAIMVLENIVRHREMGKTRFRAAIDGASEITSAATASTLAIMAIFLPIAFMKGLIGRYLFEFGVVLAGAVALSLLEALTLTPMRCAEFIDKSERELKILNRMTHAYSGIIDRLLANRWKVIGAAVLVTALSMGIVKFLRKEMVPAQDQGSLLVRLKTPDGSSIEYTDGKMKEAEKLLSGMGELNRYFGATGGFGTGDASTGVLFLTLKPKAERPIDPTAKHRLSQQEFADRLREALKQVSDTKVFIQDLSLAGFSSRRGFPVDVTIRGPELEGLAESAQKLMAEMEKSKLVTDVDSDYRGDAKEVRVYPNRERALQWGVSVSDIGQTINALYGGTVSGRYVKGGRRNDIRVKIEDADRVSSDLLKKIRVRNNRGELVSLADVVDIREEPGFLAINRKDRERTVTVNANIATGKSQQEVMAEVTKMGERVLPAGYRIVPSGSSEAFKEAFQGLIFALVLGIVIAYMVLASQYDSFIHPLTVLVALPFSISGAWIGLWVTGQSINIYSMIGVLLLMGIVKKNSILLVDYTNQLRREGMSLNDALKRACPTRLRPVVMTSVSTIAGALPAALALGPGAEARMPMAVVVIGGVLMSTFLTLLVVPCVYSLMSKLERVRAEK